MVNKKNGFTLIEIIVSIALMSVVLMIVGSIIISTTGFLSKSTQSDLDKRAVDSVIDFVRTEIQYSSDVRVVNQAPVSKNEKDDWHSIYIKDNVLYRDDKQIFSKDFYSNKPLIMSAKCNYESNQRIDIYYSLGNNEYSSRDTVVLFNLIVSDEIKNQGLYVQESKDLSVDSGGIGYRIYYNKYLSTSTPTSSTLNGTVEDIQNNIFWGNMRGKYAEGTLYSRGEIIWSDGFWWECVIGGINNRPGTDYKWKCLDKNYSHYEQSNPSYNGYNAVCSGYEEGDIVVFNGKYYQMKRDNNDGLYFKDNYSDTRITSSFWEELGSVGDASTESIVKSNTYNKRTIFNDELIIKKYLTSDISLKDPERKTVQIYSSSKSYSIGDIVRISSNPSVSSEKYYDLYIKKFNVSSGNDMGPGKGANSGWIKIDNNYSSTSSYGKDDIALKVLYNNLYFIKAKSDIIVSNSFSNSVIDSGSNQYWEKIR